MERANRYGEVVHDENDTEYWDRVRENSAGVRDLLITFPVDNSHLIQEGIMRGESIQAVIPVQEAVREREAKRVENLAKAREAKAAKRAAKDETNTDTEET